MSLSDQSIVGGFQHPVFDAQAIFRAVMDAMARPGTIADLGSRVAAPSALPQAAAAILAALADQDTPVFMEGDADGSAARWIGFQTGARVTSAPADAVFAVLASGSTSAGWEGFAIGSADYPDRSATLLLPVDALTGGRSLVLSGPGIDGEATVSPRGLPGDLLDWHRANAALFPRGLDLILVCGDAITALPRTTRIREA